jgi:hypothetical protein
MDTNGGRSEPNARKDWVCRELLLVYVCKYWDRAT